MSLELPEYTIQRAKARPALDGRWDGPAWKDVEPLSVGHYHAASSAHRPVVYAKSVYDDGGLYGIFHVEDRYVLCTHTEFQTQVYRDACVEFFVKPKPDKGHMNFEMNCGGSLLLQYIEDPARKDDGFVKYEWASEPVGRQVGLFGSLPKRVEPEITEPCVWHVE